MNDLLTLLVGVVALILLSLVWLLPTLLSPTQPGSVSAPALHNAHALRSLYQTQLAELERDRQGERLSEKDYAQAVDELQQRLLNELDRHAPPMVRQHNVWLQRGSALMLAVSLPVGAVLLYQQVGDPQAVARLSMVQEGDHMAQEGQVRAMVEGLAQRLRSQPADIPGWMMLARSYETLEQYSEAAQAYAEALEQARSSGLDVSIQAHMLANRADALASAADGDLEGEAAKAIAEALQLQPTQAKALALAGSAAVKRGDFEQARTHWQALLAQMEPGSEMALRVQDDLLKLETISRE